MHIAVLCPKDAIGMDLHLRVLILIIVLECSALYLFLSVKDAYDYQGRSFLHVPQDVGVNLKSDFPPEKCFIPKKLIHTWSGHTKGVAAIRWFPKSAHLLLSCSMDSKIKVCIYSIQPLMQTTGISRLILISGFQYLNSLLLSMINQSL